MRSPFGKCFQWQALERLMGMRSGLGFEEGDGLWCRMKVLTEDSLGDGRKKKR